MWFCYDASGGSLDIIGNTDSINEAHSLIRNDYKGSHTIANNLSEYRYDIFDITKGESVERGNICTLFSGNLDITCGNCWELYVEFVKYSDPEQFNTSCPHCFQNNLITNPFFIGER